MNTMVVYEANTREAKKYIKSQQTAVEQYIGIEHDAEDISYDDDGLVEPSFHTKGAVTQSLRAMAPY